MTNGTITVISIGSNLFISSFNMCYCRKQNHYDLFCCFYFIINIFEITKVWDWLSNMRSPSLCSDNFFHYFDDICNAPIIQIIAYEKLIGIMQILILKALDLNVNWERTSYKHDDCKWSCRNTFNNFSNPCQVLLLVSGKGNSFNWIKNL